MFQSNKINRTSEEKPFFGSAKFLKILSIGLIITGVIALNLSGEGH